MTDSTSSTTLHRHLQAALDAARQAGEIISRPTQHLEVWEKPQDGLVTEIDLQAQETIVGILREAFPDHGMLGEEGDHDDTATTAEHMWVIDPLDGTTNFVHGIPHYCVSIAYTHNGRTLVGVVLDPTRDEVFTAVRGQGAMLNGAPIRVSERATLDQLVVATGFYYDRGRMMEQTLATIHDLFSRQIHGIRRLGSAALDLAWVACGRFDAFFEYRLSPWDFAAGALLVAEAGGCCEHPPLQAGPVLAANRHVFEAFAELARWNDQPGGAATKEGH